MTDVASGPARDRSGRALVVMSLLAVPTFRTRDPSYVDGFWGIGFVSVALATLVQTDGDGDPAALLVGLTALWGLRLGGYLLWRWRKNGPDPRYQRMLASRTSGSALPLAARLPRSRPSCCWLIVAAGAARSGLRRRADGANWVGAAWRSRASPSRRIADAQLARFKNDPANPGRSWTAACGGTAGTPTTSARPSPGGASASSRSATPRRGCPARPAGHHLLPAQGQRCHAARSGR